MRFRRKSPEVGDALECGLMLLVAARMLVDPPQAALDLGVDPNEANVVLQFELGLHRYSAVLSYDGIVVA